MKQFVTSVSNKTCSEFFDKRPFWNREPEKNDRKLIKITSTILFSADVFSKTLIIRNYIHPLKNARPGKNLAKARPASAT